VRAGVLMVAAMVFSVPAWASAQSAAHSAGKSSHASAGGRASKAHGGGASHHAQQGRKAHSRAIASAHGSGTHAAPKAGSSHAAGQTTAQRHTPGEAANHPHQAASPATPASRNVGQKRPAPKPAAVRPVPHRKLVVQAPPPRVHRAIPAPHELPPILS
jgi:hypothetical protein